MPGISVELDDAMGFRLRRRTKLKWQSPPRTVLMVKKWNDTAATSKMRKIASWLESRGLRVLVEQRVHDHETPEYAAVDPSSGPESDPPRPDFAVTLGGDGTLLHLSTLFNGNDTDRQPVHAGRPPPVVSFGMGTLGFLTPFDVDDYKMILERVLRSHEEPL
jgi:NAD+ kinase